MRTRSPRLFTLAAVVLLAGAALAGCTRSTEERNPDLGAAFVKRSCGEVTPRAGALGTASPAPRSPLPLDLPALALQPGGSAVDLVVGTAFAAGPEQADMRRAVDLAAQRVNEGTTVRVRVVHAASLADAADQGAVVLLVSPATADVLDEAVRREVVVFAPATTDPGVSTEHRNEQYFYRVPPPASLEGEVLADLLWRDGCQTAGVLATDDPVGRQLGARFREAYADKGGTVREFVLVSGAPTTGHVQTGTRDDPHAVVLIAPPAAAGTAIKAAFDAGKMKRTVWFFAGVARDTAFVESVGKRENTETKRMEYVVAGLRGTSPETTTGPAHDRFLDDWAAAHGGATPGRWAAESYDATMIAALAAAATAADNQEIRGRFLREHVQEVVDRDTASDVPVRPEGIVQGLVLAATGTQVDFQGAAGDSDLDSNGDPTSGFYAWWKVNEDGTITTTRSKVEPGKPPQ